MVYTDIPSRRVFKRFIFRTTPFTKMNHDLGRTESYKLLSKRHRRETGRFLALLSVFLTVMFSMVILLVFIVTDRSSTYST